MISRGPVLELEIRERLLGVLEEVPFLRVKDWKVEKREDVDLVLQVTAGKEQWRLLVEVKQSGEPRIIRVAAQQLRTLVSDERQSYGVIGAPYISPRTAGICKEAGIGFLDLAGNCRLVFGQVFIERQGFPNPKLERRPLRALFAPKAGRVLRVLLEDPKRSCQVQVLARQAEVSLGLAFKVKQRLLDLEYAQEEEEGLRLIKPEVSTICIGMAASMATVLLSGGVKGKRYALPNSTIHMHQPMGGAQGQASDIEIAAREIIRLQDKIRTILSENTGQTYDKIAQDTDRDYYLTAEQAKEYGLVDEILGSKQ